MERNKTYLTRLFNENIENCRSAMTKELDSTACYARGCAQGIASSMYIADMLTQKEFDTMCERIRRTITMEDDIYVEK